MNKVGLSLICTIILSSCWLTKKNSQDRTRTGKTEAFQFFADNPMPAVRNALAFDYRVQAGKNNSQFTVFPYYENGYEFDYRLNGKNGYIRVTDSARLGATSYLNTFAKDSTVLKDKSSVWLSLKNYKELQNGGMTSMNTGGGEMHVFKYTKDTILKIASADTAVLISAGMARCEANGHQVVFVKDPAFPIILQQHLQFVVRVESIQFTQPEFSDFVFSEGAVLRYRIVENGYDEYAVTIKNTKWSAEELVFDVSGSYTGSYEYDFNFQHTLKGKAITAPSFVEPIITPSMKTKLETESSWFVFGLNEITNFVSKKQGYLPIPHFHYNPDEVDTTGFTPEDLENDRKAYRESWRTLFRLEKNGRMFLTSYESEGGSAMDNINLPALNLSGINQDMSIIICQQKEMPFLLYYNDNFRLEITLTYAGFEE